MRAIVSIIHTTYVPCGGFHWSGLVRISLGKVLRYSWNRTNSRGPEKRIVDIEFHRFLPWVWVAVTTSSICAARFEA